MEGIYCEDQSMRRLFAHSVTKRGSQKSLGKNGLIQNSMLHLELGIQIKQGWQFLH